MVALASSSLSITGGCESTTVTNVMAGCMRCDRMMIMYFGNISKSTNVLVVYMHSDNHYWRMMKKLGNIS